MIMKNHVLECSQIWALMLSPLICLELMQNLKAEMTTEEKLVRYTRNRSEFRNRISAAKAGKSSGQLVIIGYGAAVLAIANGLSFHGGLKTPDGQDYSSS